MTMPFKLADVNYLAVLVAGLIAFVVGAVWYTALFGKAWIRLQGFSEEKVKEMKANMSPVKFFGGMLLSYLVLAWVIAVILTGLPETEARTGATLGFFVWLGVAAIGVTNHLPSGKPPGVYLIDAGCQLVYLVLMGLLLGAWR
jgi:Protein of unknown function (DUF1761)